MDGILIISILIKVKSSSATATSSSLCYTSRLRFKTECRTQIDK